MMMSDLQLKEVLVFLNDLIFFSNTLKEQKWRLLHVLGRLKDCGLKLSLEKRWFCQTSVKKRLDTSYLKDETKQQKGIHLFAGQPMGRNHHPAH